MKKLGILILAAAILGGCDVAKTANETRDLVKHSDETLSEVKHKTILLEMHRDLFAEENTRVLNPVPFNMMVPGKNFAEALTADEAVQFVTLILSELREDQEPGGRAPADFDHGKEVRLAALNVVSGFLPQATIMQILNSHVYNRSEYREAALDILVFRANFIHEILVGKLILERAINSSGQIESAVASLEKVDFVTGLPFLSSIRVKVNTFADKAKNRVITFDPALGQADWQSLADKAREYDPNSVARWESDKSAGEQKVAQETRIMRSLIAKIDRRLARGVGKP